MQIINNLSIALVSALSATAAVGSLVQAPRMARTAGLLDKRDFPTLGDGPSIDYDTMYRYCGVAWSPPTKRALQARADIVVEPEAGSGASPDQGALTSSGFGTCIGIAVVGTNGAGGQENRFLYHLTTQSMETVRTQYNNLIADLNRVQLAVNKIWLYTVDTRNANPEFSDPANEGLQDQSDEEERVFTWVYDGLRDIPSVRAAERRFHPWSQPGSATVPATGDATFDPNN